MANSPLIQNGALALTVNGDLVSAPDIQTQMAVAIGQYNCIYNPKLNSLLIPYLQQIQVGGFNRQTCTNIVVKAYQPMIQAGIISNLTVAILAQVLSTVTIKITAIDHQGNNAQLNWSNAE